MVVLRARSHEYGRRRFLWHGGDAIRIWWHSRTTAGPTASVMRQLIGSKLLIQISPRCFMQRTIKKKGRPPRLREDWRSSCPVIIFR